MKRKLIVLSALLLGGSLFVNAQTDDCAKPRGKDNWYLGVNAGIVNYMGSAAPEWDDYNLFDQANLGFGAVLGKQITPVLSLRADFMYSNIVSVKEKNSTGGIQNWKMDANYIKLGLTSEINLINIFKYNQYRFFNVYAMLGIDLNNMQGKIWSFPDKDHEDVMLNGYERIRSLSYGASGGLGLSFNFTKNLSLNLESRLILNDNMFDKVTTYDVSAANFMVYSTAGLHYKFTNKKFLSATEERACLDKQIKGQMDLSRRGQQGDIENAIKRAIEPLQEDIEALKNSNCCKDIEDLKAKVLELEKRPGNVSSRGNGNSNYIGWSDLDPNAETVAGDSPIASVFFPFNSTVVEASQMSVIENVVNYIKKDPSIQTIIIEGYTDKVGSDNVNDILSKQRAENVKSALIRKGINSKMIKVQGMGKTTKYSSDQNSLNRRAFFKVER